MISSGTEEDPLVSISCITYNHAKFISEAIEGFMMQKTAFKFEVLIHDDASTDGTSKIIQNYEERYPDIIKPLYEKENQWIRGRYGFPAFTFPRSKGKYIALCEGDDFWTDPYKLQKQVDILEQKPGIIAVVTNASVCDVAGKKLKNEKLVIPPDNMEGIYNLHDFFRKVNRYPTLTVTFCNRHMNLITEQMNKLANPYLGDWILWVLLHMHGDFYFLNQVTAAYRINPDSLTHTVNPVKRWEADFIIRRELIQILPAEYHKYLNDDTYAYHMIGMSYRKQKKTLLFIIFQIRAFFCNPLFYIKIIFKIIKRASRLKSESRIMIKTNASSTG